MKKNFIKTFSFIFIATMVAKVLGLLRDIFFAQYYGTGFVATAFFAATRIPTQLLDIGLGAAITSTFIPIYANILKEKGKDKSDSFANNFINLIIILSGIIAVLGIIFAPFIVNMLAGGFDRQTFNLTVELIRITFPMIIFTAMAFSFVGFLQSNGEFNIPALISGISNLAIIVFLILFRESFGIHGVAAFMLVAWALQVIVQLPIAYKKGYRFKLKVNLKDENIAKVFKLALPIMISTSILPINNLVSTRIASGLEQGAVAALEYSIKLYLVIVGVITYAIGNMIFPELSKLIANKEFDKYIRMIQRGLRAITYILLPLSIGVIIFRTDIISLIYQRGEFNIQSTILTSSALMFYTIGMFGFGLVEVMNKSFYAKQDAITPLKVGSVIIAINILLCVIFSKYMGFAGLALATSVTAIINGVVLVGIGNAKNKGIINTKLLVDGVKILMSTILMAIVVIVVNKYLMHSLDNNSLSTILRIVIGGSVGAIIYYLTTIVLKVEESFTILEYIKNVIHLNKGKV